MGQRESWSIACDKDLKENDKKTTDDLQKKKPTKN
jgi:hypothetical protein